MKKLKLHLDELAVETFITDHHDVRRGTVAGQEITQNCGDTEYCTGASCDGTCYATCGDDPCASYDAAACSTQVGFDSCAGGDCFNTDNEHTCQHTDLQTCSC